MTGDENFSDGCGLISKWLRYIVLLYDCIKGLRGDGNQYPAQSKKGNYIPGAKVYTMCIPDPVRIYTPSASLNTKSELQVSYRGYKVSSAKPPIASLLT
jgi:hypothetical protein